MSLTKYFNKNYFKENIKKSKGLIALLVIIVPLITILSILLLINPQNYTKVLYENEIIWANLICMYIIPVALSFILFGYVYKKSSVDFINSMPLNRKTIFITNMITPQFGAADNDTGVITINNKEYRGKIQPTRVNGGSIIPVNAVSIEEYLYGVVPSEMSPSYAEEALKAQAVAARTYAIKKMDMKVHENKGYDLCDGTHCQSYKGKSAEFPATNAAVDATKGLVIYHKGEPIEAVFFASSGGYTENSEDIWTAPLPYLKAVPDVYEVDTNTWTKKITATQLTNLTSAKGDNIGQVTDMVISKVSLGEKKSIECSPTIFPPRILENPISFGFLFSLF